jgi:diadenosine tetraphosphate (Ap4A) HIT family hydrolase
MPPTPSSTYERLRDYIATRMRMSHVYQPSAIADADPVTPGHSLVIPRRHGADGLALHQPEWNAVVELPHPIVHKWTSTC